MPNCGHHYIEGVTGHRGGGGHRVGVVLGVVGRKNVGSREFVVGSVGRVGIQ